MRWAKWPASGREALVMHPRGSRLGAPGTWEAQQAAVRQADVDHLTCDVGLSGQLWTKHLVSELNASEYRVRLAEPGVGKYLKPWGMPFQRPNNRRVEQDQEAARARLEEGMT